MITLRFLLLLLLCWPSFRAGAQHDAVVMINADNIGKLRSVYTLDFANLYTTGFFDSGFFALSNNGNIIANRNANIPDIISRVILWDWGLNYTYAAGTHVIDIAFSPNTDYVVSLHTDGETNYIASLNLVTYEQTTYKLSTADLPLTLWVDAALNVWAEVQPGDPAHAAYIVAVSIWSENKEVRKLAYAPGADPTAFVRIGRIPPPFAVTSTQDGLVKLWNLETGEVVASAQVDDIPVFGQINASGSHLVWRSPDSSALHLLDFSTGQDKMIAPLNGEYIQFLFLTPGADVIMGVHVGGQPVVTAWDVETGKRYELGEYRSCSRVPDMARLSRDGTTLVIGCDTGLDIWRVIEDNTE